MVVGVGGGQELAFSQQGEMQEGFIILDYRLQRFHLV